MRSTAATTGWKWIGPLVLAAGIGAPLAFYFADFMADGMSPLKSAFAGEGELGRLAGLLARTCGIAALSAGLALAIALGMRGFLETGGPVRRWVLLIAFVPLFLPGHFLGIAWIQTFGNAGWGTALVKGALGGGAWIPELLYSPIGCAGLLALHYFPVALAVLMVGRRGVPATAIDAAALMMPPGAVWRVIVFGWMRLWLVVAWLVIFILSLLDYSIPALLRTHVFTVEIMSAFDVYYEPARALALALPLEVVALAAASVLGFFLRQAGKSEQGEPTRDLPNSGWGYRGMFLALTLAAIIGAVVLPAANQLAMIRGWGDIETTWVSARRQAGISIMCALAAATLAVGLATLLAAPPGSVAVNRRRWTDGAMLACFALPGSVFGLAQLSFWNRNWSGGFYDSGWMLPVGLALLFLPVAYAMLRAKLRQMPDALEELERINGPLSLSRWSRVTLPPLVVPGMMAAVLVFTLALQEVHATILLAAPGQETLSVRAMTLLHYAPDGVVAAFCLIVPMVIAAAVVFGWLVVSMLKRVAERRAPEIDFD